MKSVIVTCFESNEPRVCLIRKAFENLNFETSVITTDFSHINKAKRNNVPDDYNSINTISYKKNLSIARLKSHYKFSKDAFAKIEEYMPDVVWLCAPANSLIKEAKVFKKKYPKVKIIIDVIDMWPESLPLKLKDSFFPLKIWKNIRTNNIDVADYLVTECNLYKDVLSKEYHKTIKTIFWGKSQDVSMIDYKKNEDKLHLVYLGSINNIIDIDGICKFISRMDKKVVVHVIGDGERRDYFISCLKECSEVEYHGVIRDEKEKSRILNECHAGINMYKKGLYIGLTVKCIDYFANGLPIINNISNDTWDMVDKYKVGINVNDTTNVLSKDIFELRNNYKDIRTFFESNFSKEKVICDVTNVIHEVTK